MVLLKVAVLQSCSIRSSTTVGTVRTIDNACSQNLLRLSKTTRSLFKSFGEFFVAIVSLFYWGVFKVE